MANRGGDLPHGIVIGRMRASPGFNVLQLLPQSAGQHHLAIRVPPKQAVRPEILVVVSVHRLPAELLLQVLGSGLLDKGVFGIKGGRQSSTSQWPSFLSDPSQQSILLQFLDVPLHRTLGNADQFSQLSE